MPLHHKLLILLSALAATAAAAADYHVSPSGDDAASGLSPNEPLRSLIKVNAIKLKPGDRVLLQGGANFEGTVAFDAADAGTAEKPIVLASYGEGSATIKAGRGNGVSLHNCAGISISNLVIQGAGIEGNDGDGIVFFNDLPDDVKLGYVRIENVEIGGFGRHGIALGGRRGACGYRDIRISKALVFENGIAGIATFGNIFYSIEDIHISGCKAFRNHGVSMMRHTSGHGIVLGSVNGGTIERCVVFENGRLADQPEGPIGIWAWNSTNITIQFNEAYNNRTAGKLDGGGFALHQNVSASRVQYNYSHGNDGPGFLLSHEPDSRGFTGNVVRFNISQNDARKNGYGAITVFGRVMDSEVYNNTVFLNSASTGAAKAVYIYNTGVENRRAGNLNFRNNIFQTSAGVPLLEVGAPQLAAHGNLHFQGNAWFTSGDKFEIRWGKHSFNDLASWRRDAAQEQLDGKDTGASSEPRLANAGGAPILDTLAGRTADAYRLQKDSPLINAGLDLEKLFKIDTGPHDFFKTPLTASDGFDIGAHNYTP